MFAKDPQLIREIIKDLNDSIRLLRANKDIHPDYSKALENEKRLAENELKKLEN